MEAENPRPAASPQTDGFILWGSFLFLLAASFFMWSSLREDQLRLAGLQKIESDRLAERDAAQASLAQGTQILTRFNDDPEFVRDQARERLGVAAPDEVVIRIEPGAAPASGRPAAPLFAPPAPEADR